MTALYDSYTGRRDAEDQRLAYARECAAADRFTPVIHDEPPSGAPRWRADGASDEGEPMSWLTGPRRQG